MFEKKIILTMIPIEHSWQESCGNEIELLNFNPRKTFLTKVVGRFIFYSLQVNRN